MSIFTIARPLAANNFKLLNIALTVIAVIALLLAYYVEYIMEIAPCPLCIYQRFPYLSLIKITATALVVKKSSKYSVFFTTCTLITAILLSGYHTAIERDLIEPSALCSVVIKIPEHLSINEVKKLFYNQPTETCAKPAIKFLGFSMTELNLILNLSLLIIVIVVWIEWRRDYAKTSI